MHGRAVLLLTVLAVWAKCDSSRNNKCDISQLMLNPIFCASDGKTYTSFCQLEKAKAKNRQLTVTHIGPCVKRFPGYIKKVDQADYADFSPPKGSKRNPSYKECSSKRGCIVVGDNIFAVGSDVYYSELKKNKKLKNRNRGGVNISNGAQNNNNINARGNRGRINVVNDANNNNNFNGGAYYGDINIDNEATNINSINADGFNGDLYLDNVATNNNNFNRLKIKKNQKLYFNNYRAGINVDNQASNNNNFNSGGIYGNIHIRNQATNNNNFNTLKKG